MRSLRILVVLLVVLLGLAAAPSALASGGRYVFEGGTDKERAQVRAALEASSFDWSLVPGTVTIHLRAGGPTHSLPGAIHLDSNVLTAGMFAWAVVQDQYAHQLDFRLLDADRRALLSALIGAPSDRALQGRKARARR